MMYGNREGAIGRGIAEQALATQCDVAGPSSSPLQLAFSELDGAIHELDNRIERLHERLAPIMNVPPPECGNKCSTASLGQSQLVQNIEEKTAYIGRLIRSINDIMGRIEL